MAPIPDHRLGVDTTPTEECIHIQGDAGSKEERTHATRYVSLVLPHGCLTNKC